MKYYNEASAIIFKAAEFENTYVKKPQEVLKKAKELRRVVERFIDEVEKNGGVPNSHR